MPPPTRMQHRVDYQSHEQRRRDPKQYTFSRADQRRYLERFWRCPDRLVREGLWAELWRLGSGIPSVLPTLAAHARHDSGKGWSHDFTLSHRRIAALSGVCRGTVAEAIRRLKIEGLLDRASWPSRARQLGGEHTRYRLSADLFPKGSEKFTQIFASLVYGGVWTTLPLSARGLYLVLACADPVKSEWSLIDRLEQDHHSEPECAVEEMRERATLSFSELAHISGQSRRGVINALKVLTTPFFRPGKRDPPLPLFHRGRPDSSSSAFWYAVDAEVRTAFVDPRILNDPASLRAERSRIVSAAKASAMRVME